jgi:DNA-binding NtrC family response regulator
MVLLVDDDPGFLRSAERYLHPDHGLLFASTARDARALMQTIHFSVALVDLDLPDQSGFELIRELHATRPELPIVAISGVFSRTILEAAKEFGAVEILHKPVNAEWATVVERLRKSG